MIAAMHKNTGKCKKINILEENVARCPGNAESRCFGKVKEVMPNTLFYGMVQSKLTIIIYLLSFLYHDYLQENLPRSEEELQKEEEEFQREEELSKDNKTLI